MPTNTTPLVVRRSPRLQRTSQSPPSPRGSHALPPVSSQPMNERRRLQFHPSVEAVTVPSSVDVLAQPSLQVNASSAYTSAPGSQAQTLSDVDTVPPDSNARRFSDMDTVPPDSDARRFSDMDTAPPDSDAQRFSDMDTVTPHSQARRSSGLSIEQPQQVDEAGLPGVGAIGQGADAEQEGGAVVINDHDCGTSSDVEQVRISAAPDICRVFAFLSRLSVKKLRVILKSWNWRQSGKKEVLIAKAMLHLHLSLISGKRLGDVLSTQGETSRYESWLRERLSRDEIYPESIDKAPTEDTLIGMLVGIEAGEYRRKKIAIERARSGLNRINSEPEDEILPNEPQNGAIQTIVAHDEATDSTQFCINEFARLLIIMRDDEDARAAVRAMGQDLTRAQLDAGITRDNFWTIVEQRFNDPGQNRFLNLAARVDGVDSTQLPLAHRSASSLKNRFNDSKADFTQFVTRWSASGQNDPDRFRNFLPTLANGELNALGKRMMVMFVCTGKGTPYEHEDFTNICCKLIPGGAGRDEGSRHSCGYGDGAATQSSGLAQRQQRRKRANPDAEGASDIATSMSKIASCYEGKRTVKAPTESEKMLKHYSCRLKKIRILKSVVAELKEQPIEDVPNEDPDSQIDAGMSLVLALRKLHRDVAKDLLRGSDEEES